mmetsp:Transcript_125060/g.365251  ORF Transcript_125060/g.365251 Transcript_125060/m.365251 type:complete len:213 (-) Transcript_125060:290-928(-)
MATSTTTPYLLKCSRSSYSPTLGGRPGKKYRVPSTFFLPRELAPPSLPCPFCKAKGPPPGVGQASQPPLAPAQPQAAPCQGPHSGPQPPHASPPQGPPAQPPAVASRIISVRLCAAGEMDTSCPATLTCPTESAMVTASSEPKVTKPKFLRSPVLGSFGKCTSITTPKRENTSRMGSAGRSRGSFPRCTLFVLKPARLSFVSITETAWPPMM